MTKRIHRVEFKIPKLITKKKVAAYARVSVSKDRSLHSLSQQVSFYNDYITRNKEWEFVGVFSDLGVSGSTTKRDGFKEMMKACEEGKIDLILTKSISRFGRNTLDLLSTVRHLKSIGVEVHFEKENIRTFSSDGELMISILASFAQEEARSISNNVKWGIRKRFKEGKGNSYILYGYRWDGEKFNIVPEEAEVVRYCFQNYLDSKSAEITSKELADKNIKLSPSSIRKMLLQEKYTGNSLLQKTYTDFITKRERKNNGELPMYWAENTHPKIIDLETFNKVQEDIKRRRELGIPARFIKVSCFTSKIRCSCGKNYQRGKSRKHYVWMCITQKKGNRKGCKSRLIHEDIIRQKCAEALGIDEFNEDVFNEKIDHINVLENEALEFIFKKENE